MIENRIERKGGFAGLPIAENQLALTTPDGNERIDDFEAGLKRRGNGRTVHDRRRRAFDRQALAGDDRPVAIQGPTERIDHAPQHAIAHGYVHDPARALDFTARLETPVFAEQHNTNVVLVNIERHAEHLTGKRHQFVKTHAGKAGDLGDAGGDTGDRADLLGRQLRREGFAHLTDARKRAVENVLEALRFRVHGWVVAV